MRRVQLKKHFLLTTALICSVMAVKLGLEWLVTMPTCEHRTVNALPHKHKSRLIPGQNCWFLQLSSLSYFFNVPRSYSSLLSIHCSRLSLNVFIYPALFIGSPWNGECCGGSSSCAEAPEGGGSAPANTPQCGLLTDMLEIPHLSLNAPTDPRIGSNVLDQCLSAIRPRWSQTRWSTDTSEILNRRLRSLRFGSRTLSSGTVISRSVDTPRFAR